MANSKYITIIGLEVHVELATNSKMFCGCPAEHFGVEPNTHTCPVCLGLPGALPVPNKKAIDWTILLGLALGCQINEHSKFDRKNYFYPDLPKGYQITQYDQPFATGGQIRIMSQEAGEKIIRIRRVHLEEDTGKLQHQTGMTLVDFNRSGVPLVEIVTEPDFRSIEEVDVYLKKLQRLIRYLGISNADMEKGSMRLEPSISLSKTGELPAYRVELKNINSFRFARKALEYEIKRQTELLEAGERPTQQTRGWSEAKNATVPQREKEEAHDYRYFPEPDIPPIHIDKGWLEAIKSQIPELPDDKLSRFKEKYGLSEYQANILTEDSKTADYYEETIKQARKLPGTDSQLALDMWRNTVANWIINKKLSTEETMPAQLIGAILKTKQTIEIDITRVDEVLEQNPQAVTDYKAGKTAAFSFLLGQLLKALPSAEKSALIEALKSKL